MNGFDKKAALVAYKERKTIAGVFAVRCTGAGRCWVGQAPNIDAMQNRIWFCLRHGSGLRAEVLEAWRSFGEQSFSFEALERISEEEPMARARLIKERTLFWQGRLGALNF